MRLTFYRVKYLVFIVAAIITLSLWAYAFLNFAGVADWTLANENKFTKAWNFAISREGTVIVSGSMALVVLVTVLVDRRRESHFAQRRRLREQVLRRRLERVKDGQASAPTLPLISSPHDTGDVSALARTAAAEQAESQRTPTPDISCIGARVDFLYMSAGGEITDSPHNPSLTVIETKLAVAEFYRPPDETNESTVEVRAHISFDGQLKHRVNDGIWREHPLIYKAFHVGDTAVLIIAFVKDSPGAVAFIYQGSYRKSTFHGVPLWEFFENFVALKEKSYRVTVELIGKKGGPNRLHKTFDFDLTITPEFSFQKRQAN